MRKRYGLKHIHDYGLTYDANTPYKSVLTSFIFDDNEEYVISIENQKLRAFRLLADGSVSLVATVTSDVNSAALPFDEDYANEYTFAQYGDVMWVCHPLFSPRLVTRTSLTTFEVSTFSFDTRSDNSKIYQPYYNFQAQGVTLDPSAATGTGITLTTSDDYWVAAHAGTNIRYHESEITITSVTSATVAVGDVVLSLIHI